MKKVLFVFNYTLFCMLILPTIVAAQSKTAGGLPGITADITNEKERAEVVVKIVKYLIVCFDYTAAFYDVMCWLSLFITAALGIKQLFIKTDEDRGGGFWNVLKIAGWGIAGLLGIIIKSSLGDKSSCG